MQSEYSTVAELILDDLASNLKKQPNITLLSVVDQCAILYENRLYIIDLFDNMLRIYNAGIIRWYNIANPNYIDNIIKDIQNDKKNVER
jgi:hypothetical protein